MEVAEDSKLNRTALKFISYSPLKIIKKNKYTKKLITF